MVHRKNKKRTIILRGQVHDLSSTTPRASEPYDDVCTEAAEAARRMEKRKRDRFQAYRIEAAKRSKTYGGKRTHVVEDTLFVEEIAEITFHVSSTSEEDTSHVKELLFHQTALSPISEEILDSTEKAVEHSLASTGHANSRAMEVYSQSLKTTCFTWLLIFVMTCIFVMIVLLIRVT